VHGLDVFGRRGHDHDSAPRRRVAVGPPANSLAIALEDRGALRDAIVPPVSDIVKWCVVLA